MLISRALRARAAAFLPLLVDAILWTKIEWRLPTGVRLESWSEFELEPWPHLVSPRLSQLTALDCWEDRHGVCEALRRRSQATHSPPNV